MFFVIPEYGDLHRALVQTLMGHGTVEKSELIKIFRLLSQHINPEAEFNPEVLDRFIEDINEKIGDFDQKITKYEYGLTNDEFYVFHSTAKTSMSKLQDFYKEEELDFFKQVLNKILQNENLKISPRDALNLSSELKLNKLRAQYLIDVWMQNHYFFKHNDNQIYLGAKTLAEFKEYLQSLELNYLKSCLLCEMVAVWGDHCKACDTVYHSSCIRKFLTRSEKCPSCKERWEVPASD